MDFKFCLLSAGRPQLSSMFLVWPPGGVFHTKCACADSSGISDSSGNSLSIKKFITQQILNGINPNLVSN